MRGKWMCLLAAAAIPVRCQAPSNPLLEFEVASVKPHPWPELAMVPGSGHPRLFTSSGSLFTDHLVAMQQVIMQAFDLQDYQVLGLPAWAKFAWVKKGLEYYDIDARTPTDNPTVADMRLMLQSLLAERCNLRFHWETRELPVYALSISKGGLKGKAVASGEPNSSGPCENDARVQCFPQNIFTLIVELSLFVDRPITDHTGLEGEFRFKDVPHTNDARLEACRPPNCEKGPAAYSQRAIAAMFEETYGLKLEAKKEAIQALVVDQIERPSPN